MELMHTIRASGKKQAKQVQLQRQGSQLLYQDTLLARQHHLWKNPGLASAQDFSELPPLVCCGIEARERKKTGSKTEYPKASQEIHCGRIPPSWMQRISVCWLQKVWNSEQSSQVVCQTL